MRRCGWAKGTSASAINTRLNPSWSSRSPSPSHRTGVRTGSKALYLAELARRGVPFDHIPRLYGWIDTSQGPGLMFERIANSDGTPLITLQAGLEQGLLTPSESANDCSTSCMRICIATQSSLPMSGSTTWCANAVPRAGIWSSSMARCPPSEAGSSISTASSPS